jgi:hypothetical protein
MLPTADLSILSIELTIGWPDSSWNVTACTDSAEKTKYSVASDISQQDFYDLFEEMTTKIVRAHRQHEDHITMMVSGEHLLRDAGYSLPSK